MTSLRLSDVTVTVPGSDREPDRTILDIPELDLAEPRIGVVGGNGSGKSTLLRLLNGLVLPSTGRVTVDGLDTTSQGPEIRRRVGFVFTDPLSQLVMPTPREDIELSLRRLVRNPGQRRSAAARILDEHGLAALADNSIYSLSGGERQLTAFATVLAVQPRVLLLDEPSTLLDLRNTLRLRARLKAVEQQVITATHDLEFAADFERVIVMHAGSVVFDGAAAAAIAFYRGLCAREV